MQETRTPEQDKEANRTRRNRQTQRGRPGEGRRDGGAEGKKDTLGNGENLLLCILLRCFPRSALVLAC